MKPMIQVRPMNDLSPFKRKKVCEHTPQCGKFLLINTLTDGMTLCHKDAIDYGYALLDELEVLPEVHVRGSWTADKTLQVIEYIRKNDVKHGTYTKLAMELGLTPRQVKNKVYHLRRQGAF